LAQRRVVFCTHKSVEIRYERGTKLGTDVVEVLGIPVDFAFYGKEQRNVCGIGFVLVDIGSIYFLNLFHKVQENIHRVIEQSSIGEEIGLIGTRIVLFRNGFQITPNVGLFFTLLRHQSTK